MDIFLRSVIKDRFFFLDASEFHHAALLPLPYGPPTALLNAMYLWASRFNRTANGQDDFLALAVHHLALEVAAIQTFQPPLRILQIIQASVLLSVYYLEAGLLVEGKYHCAGATSLAFSAGLHRIGSSSPAPHLPFLNSSLAVPPDIARAKEMVDAFWSVVTLNNYWVAVSGTPSSILWGPSITTPWPTVCSSFLHSRFSSDHDSA